MNTPTPHPQAALIKSWADDPRQQVWYRSDTYQEWTGCSFNVALFDLHQHIAIGPKPTAPLRRVCTLGGLEFPEPESATPPPGARFFLVGSGESLTTIWGGTSLEFTWLVERYIHLTREAAEAHSRALLAANLEAVRGAR